LDPLTLLSDPRIGFGLAMVLSTLGSIKGYIPWKWTGALYVLGGAFYYLSAIFGPEAAAAMIISNIVSYMAGQIKASIKQMLIKED